MLVRPKQRQAQRGLSLVEVIVVLAIVAVLGRLAITGYGEWVAGQRVRVMTESILNGLQLARANAISKNKRVQFNLANDGGWSINEVDFDALGALIQSRNAGEGANAQAVSWVITPNGATVVTFNALGRVIDDPTVNVNATISTVDVSSAGDNIGRALRVVVSNSGEMKMCDPLAPAGDTRRC